MKHNITAIIYDKRGKPLSIGYNSYIKTHPLQYKVANKLGEPHKIYLHAEIAAIVKLQHNDKERAHTIRVFRYNRQGKSLNAKPCALCQHAIGLLGLHVEHT